MDTEKNWKEYAEVVLGSGNLEVFGEMPRAAADINEQYRAFRIEEDGHDVYAIYPEDLVEYSEHLHAERESAREHLEGSDAGDNPAGSIRAQASNIGLPAGTGGR